MKNLNPADDTNAQKSLKITPRKYHRVNGFDDKMLPAQGCCYTTGRTTVIPELSVVTEFYSKVRVYS